MVKQTNLQKFLESQSYKKDFKDLMLGLEKKYSSIKYSYLVSSINLPFFLTARCSLTNSNSLSLNI